MDSFRIFAGMIFAISVFLLVDAWVRDHQKVPPSPPPSAAKQGDSTAPVPSTPLPSTPLGQPPSAAPKPADGKLSRGERIRVVTDLLVAEIDTVGGDLRHIEFTKYRDTFDPKKNFVLLEETSEHVYVAQSGLIGEGLPNHTTLFRAAQRSYELGTGNDTIVVRLEAVGANGVKVAKTYQFRRGSYVIDLAFETTNVGVAAIEPFAYFQLVRDTKPPPGDSRMVPTFNGAEVYTEKDKLQKVSFDDILKNKTTYPKNAADGWIAIVQHYFLGA
jgi:YidC/Oxa1 family membrane protein insertase